MKIRLITNLPIADHHGAKKGKTYEVIRQDEMGRGRKKTKRFWVKGDAGEEFAVLPWEFEEVE